MDNQYISTCTFINIFILFLRSISVSVVTVLQVSFAAFNEVGMEYFFWEIVK